MKNLLFIIIILSVIIPASCRKTSANAAAENTGGAALESEKPLRIIPENAPQFVIDSVRDIPLDAYVGIGSARSATIGMARSTAITRAHADISRQMDAAGKTVEHLEDGTVVSAKLSSATLTGVSIIDEEIDENGNYWVVVTMPAASVK